MQNWSLVFILKTLPEMEDLTLFCVVLQEVIRKGHLYKQTTMNISGHQEECSRQGTEDLFSAQHLSFKTGRNARMCVYISIKKPWEDNT